MRSQRCSSVSMREKSLSSEAITLHGEDSPPAPGQAGRSEAQEARDAYVKLSPDDQRALVAFLKSLVNFSSEE